MEAERSSEAVLNFYIDPKKRHILEDSNFINDFTQNHKYNIA